MKLDGLEASAGMSDGFFSGWVGEKADDVRTFFLQRKFQLVADKLESGEHVDERDLAEVIAFLVERGGYLQAGKLSLDAGKITEAIRLYSSEGGLFGLILAAKVARDNQFYAQAVELYCKANYLELADEVSLEWHDPEAAFNKYLKAEDYDKAANMLFCNFHRTNPKTLTLAERDIYRQAAKGYRGDSKFKYSLWYAFLGGDPEYGFTLLKDKIEYHKINISKFTQPLKLFTIALGFLTVEQMHELMRCAKGTAIFNKDLTNLAKELGFSDLV